MTDTTEDGPTTEPASPPTAEPAGAAAGSHEGPQAEPAGDEPEADEAEAVARSRAWVLPALVVAAVVALPLRGFFLTPGAPFEEGFMLAFPERLLEGDIPNKDFLHLYGPGSLWVLAAFYQVLGVDIWVERLVGLLQLVGVIAGVTYAGYRWGRWPAALGGSIAAVLIMPPVGLTALAWAGGMAFSVWAVIRIARAVEPGDALAGTEVGPAVADADAARTEPAGTEPSDAGTAGAARAGGPSTERVLFTAGLLAAAALLFRPDQVLALGLPFAAVFLWGATAARERKALVGGLAIGLIPYLVHMAIAGPGNVVNGMVVETVFELRPGRTLPFPPDPDELTSFLNRALLFRNWPWPFPHLSEPTQVFIWVPILFAVTGFVLWTGWRSQRAGRPLGWLLLLLGLFCVGTMPQVVQRVDTAHLAWVSAVPFGLLPAALTEWHRMRAARPGVAARALLPLLPVVIMFALIPHYSVRWYADYAGQSFGYKTENIRSITNRGRTFYYGRIDAAEAANALLADVEELTEPGDRLIVGTGDLRFTPYTETFFYYLLPQLEPGTHYMEMEPGITNAEGSELADELREADVYIASTLYDDWNEPNASMDEGSDEPNQVLEDEFCLHDSYGTYWEGDARYGQGMYELWLRC